MSDKATSTNPYYVRRYRLTTDAGCAEVNISAPGGQFPVSEDANELIEFLQLIIRQIERTRNKHEKDEFDRMYPPKPEATT